MLILDRREGTGNPYREMCRYSQQFGSKGFQGERNRCDSKGNLWTFIFGFRIGYIWALSQLCLCTHNPDRSYNNYFSISVHMFDPNGISIFFVSMIHQIIWLSPGTLTSDGVPMTILIAVSPARACTFTNSLPLWPKHQLKRELPVLWLVKIEKLVTRGYNRSAKIMIVHAQIYKSFKLTHT